MSFLTQLLQDAEPRATSIKNTTANVVDRLAHNKAVAVSKTIGYKGLVNTVGIGMVLAQPLVEKTKKLGSKAWSKVEELAADPKASK